MPSVREDAVRNQKYVLHNLRWKTIGKNMLLLKKKLFISMNFNCQSALPKLLGVFSLSTYFGDILWKPPRRTMYKLILKVNLLWSTAFIVCSQFLPFGLLFFARQKNLECYLELFKCMSIKGTIVIKAWNFQTISTKHSRLSERNSGHFRLLNFAVQFNQTLSFSNFCHCTIIKLNSHWTIIYRWGG